MLGGLPPVQCTLTAVASRHRCASQMRVTTFYKLLHSEMSLV